MDATVGNVLYPVSDGGDMAAAVAFYRDGVGLPVKFQDGDRYAALDGGGTTFALAGGSEVMSRHPVASFKVADLAEVITRVRAAGGTIGDPVEGGHEFRAVGHDPAGNEFVLYMPKPT